MEHNKLSLEYDRNLINTFLNNKKTKYIILYLYIIRKELFNNLDHNLINSYEKILILDDIYKNNVELLWDPKFIDMVIDLGLFKNVRSRLEYDQKDGDFILRMGENTVTIEKNTILTPLNTLFNMILKRFKSLSQREFELGITQLKEVRCESTGIIHHFIYEVGENDYILSDDLYNILDQYGNIYQAIKIEPTADGLLLICKEILEKIANILNIFDPILNNENIFKILVKVLEINKEEKLEINELVLKVNFSGEDIIIAISNSDFLILSNYKDEMGVINKQIFDIKSNYTSNQNYLEFLERLPSDINGIRKSLIELRDNVIGAKNAVLDLESRLLKQNEENLNLSKKDNKFQENITELDLNSLIHYCKNLKDKVINIIRIFNPILNNKTIINKIVKTLGKNQNILKKFENEIITLEQISLDLKTSSKNYILTLSNSDFQILLNYKDELERLYKKLQDLEASEDEDSNETLNDIKHNIIGARNSILDIENRTVYITEKKE